MDAGCWTGGRSGSACCHGMEVPGGEGAVDDGKLESPGVATTGRLTMLRGCSICRVASCSSVELAAKTLTVGAATRWREGRLQCHRRVRRRHGSALGAWANTTDCQLDLGVAAAGATVSFVATARECLVIEN